MTHQFSEHVVICCGMTRDGWKVSSDEIATILHNPDLLAEKCDKFIDAFFSYHGWYWSTK